jgi:GNAT superfamily N-acetyltransferase
LQGNHGGLPEWFEAAEGITACAEAVKTMPMFAASANGQITGFIALKCHPPVSVEIFVIATDRKFHGKGTGRRLVQAAEDHALRNGCRLLTVKTLAPRDVDEPHLDRTRAFYRSNGFLPAETFLTLWGEGHPCLFLVKPLNGPKQYEPDRMRLLPKYGTI